MAIRIMNPTSSQIMIQFFIPFQSNRVVMSATVLTVVSGLYKVEKISLTALQLPPRFLITSCEYLSY
jgi:hypothetical protein